jgi:predicted dehydrogenase
MDIAASGEIGEIRHVELHALRRAPAAEALPGSWRLDPALAGGGILVDHGWHNLVVIRRLLGGPARRVCARLTGRPVDREATVYIEFPDATALMHLSWLAAERANRGVVYGTRGAVELLDDKLRVAPVGGSARLETFPEKLSASSSHPEWFEAVLTGFDAALKAPDRAADNLAEAEFCAAVIHRAQGAARAQGPRIARGTLLLQESRP